MLKKFLTATLVLAMFVTTSLGCFAEGVNAQNQVSQNQLVINGKTITADELERLLKQEGVQVIYEADNLDEVIQNGGMVEAHNLKQGIQEWRYTLFLV